MAEEKRSNASAIDRPRELADQIEAVQRLFLAVLPAALSDAHELSVLAGCAQNI